MDLLMASGPSEYGLELKKLINQSFSALYQPSLQDIFKMIAIISQQQESIIGI
jgi:hypothetical protein